MLKMIQEKVFASIITIGDELLIGQVIDTNSAWIAQALDKLGISVIHRLAVGDDASAILQALDAESKIAQLIIITGGLGPTADDITKPILCEYFHGKMVIHQPTLDHITHLFEEVLKRPMIERNRKQAELPDTCQVLMNLVGTAPGMLFQKNNTLFVSLPGVPHEMKWLMNQELIPILKERYQSGFIAHRTLITYGIGESFLADLINDIETAIPPNIKLAYLPNSGMVRLRLSGFAWDESQLNTQVDHQFSLLKDRLTNHLVADQDIPMEIIVSNLLKERKQTLSTAESCTGGYLAHLLTSHSGASQFFKGSIIAYHNDVKTNVLSVPSNIIANKGAVSEQTVSAMAKQVLVQMQTDYAIAVSGIMGPEGGTPEKPVGLVWVAIANSKNCISRSFQFKFDRKRNIEQTAISALNLLRIFILENS